MPRRNSFDQELRLWDEMQPVGREFGSPDFERLMAEDARAGIGVFDPALKQRARRAPAFPSADMP